MNQEPHVYGHWRCQKYPKRMTFIGDFAGEAETRKEAIEKEIQWLKEEKKDD